MTEQIEPSFALLGPEYLDDLCRIEEASFSHPWSREEYRRELTENPVARYLGCFCQGELAGFLGLWLVLDEGQIANVAVAPAWRGQGLGRALMEQAIVLCLALGGRILRLEVREHNQTARGLYQSLGFREVGRRRDYYTQPTEDAILMDLDLCPAEPQAENDTP